MYGGCIFGLCDLFKLCLQPFDYCLGYMSVYVNKTARHVKRMSCICICVWICANYNRTECVI